MSMGCCIIGCCMGIIGCCGCITGGAGMPITGCCGMAIGPRPEGPGACIAVLRASRISSSELDMIPPILRSSSRAPL